ncbi:hypothetical protein E3A20_04040 [Planctomyces bekefii]|uniref:Uncharacterized protein n=1 Tax=Planctomyces bekefii TaxID=1653850 RepID=A0A5C6MAE7_9PLAN|nr:hypothetical protein E3A20_04040 [Planctomyces bekefii]
MEFGRTSPAAVDAAAARKLRRGSANMRFGFLMMVRQAAGPRMDEVTGDVNVDRGSGSRELERCATLR